MRTLLAFGWGALAAAPLLRAAARARVAARALALRPVKGTPVVEPAGRRGRRERRRAASLAAAVPSAADLLGVALAAGLTPYLALRVAARSAPEPVAARVAAVVASVEGGRRLADVLEEEARAAPPLGPVLEVLLASERFGAPVGPALARLAADGRARLRRAALARARTLPVRLLFPLVFLVLPAFLLLTVGPVLLAGLRR
jgi:tight adherence protein C